MQRARALGLAVLVASPFAMREAGAQIEAEPIVVAYDAPPDCPTRDAFFGEISARTPRARAARPGEKARVMRVTIKKRGAGHSGRLVIEDEAGTSSPRDVAGASCGEVVGALGLVAALAVDPRASVAARPAPSPPSAPPPPASQSGSVAEGPTSPGGAPGEPPEAPATQGSAAPLPPAPTTTAEPRPAPTPPPPAEGPRRARFAVGAGVEVSALADAVVSPRLFGEIALARDRSRLVAPSARLALARSLAVDRTPAVGRATLRWTTATLDLCPVGLALARTVAVLPCAGATGGVIDADGTDVNGAESRTRPWLTADVQGRLVWAPAALLSFEVEGGAIFPLLRESFFFLPGVPVYEAPVTAGFGRAGVAIHFP